MRALFMEKPEASPPGSAEEAVLRKRWSLTPREAEVGRWRRRAEGSPVIAMVEPLSPIPVPICQLALAQPGVDGRSEEWTPAGRERSDIGQFDVP